MESTESIRRLPYNEEVNRKSIHPHQGVDDEEWLRKLPVDGHAPVLDQEIEEGNREYKLTFVGLNQEGFTHRITQLNWRLNEGMGEAIYEIGVADDGTPVGMPSEHLRESMQTLQRMATALGCTVHVQHIFSAKDGRTAQILVRRVRRLDVSPVHVQVAVVGSVSAGKSTLVSVLARGALDNGRGLARSQVLRHFHEVETGRTSSISPNVMSFDSSGLLLCDAHTTQTLPEDEHGRGEMDDHRHHCLGLEACGTPRRRSSGRSAGSSRLRAFSDSELADRAARVVTLLDLAGHEKYLKTTVRGMIGRSPALCLLTVHPTMPITHVAKEHVAVAVALQLPLCVAVTHCDRASKEGVKLGVGAVTRLLEGCGRRITIIESLADLAAHMEAIESVELGACSRDAASAASTAVPIFKVSCVTGDGIALLRRYLFLLPAHSRDWGDLRIRETSIRVLDCFDGAEADASAPDVHAIPARFPAPAVPVLKPNPSIDASNSNGNSNHGRARAGSLVELGPGPIMPTKAKDRPTSDVLVHGLVEEGCVAVDQPLHFGPCPKGLYRDATVKSVRVNNVPVQRAVAGQCATLVLDVLCPATFMDGPASAIHIKGRSDSGDSCGSMGSRGDIEEAPVPPTYSGSPGAVVLGRKRGEGLVLLSQTLKPSAHFHFEADVLLFNHPKAVTANYQPVIHTKCIRQSAALLSLRSTSPAPCGGSGGETGRGVSVPESNSDGAGEEAWLAVGGTARCLFRFLYRPEFLIVGSKIVLREGQTRGVGTVVSVGEPAMTV